MKGNTLLLVAAITATTSLSLAAESQLTLEQRIQQLEQQNLTGRRLQSDMSIQLNELQKEVKELRGVIEEHDFMLQQIKDRQRELYRDIDSRLSAAPQERTSTPSENDNKISENQTNVQAQTGVKVDPATPVSSSGDGRAEFEKAFKLVRNKDYVGAIAGFEAFLTKHPTGNYSDNARFWIGQIYFAQSNLTEAEKQFSLLRSEFPQSSKMSAAILKLAEIKAKQQQWQAAKTLYNEVINNYTGSSQQLARKGLQDIAKLGH